MSRHALRVASRIKFLLSHIIQRELNDPRLGFITILNVEPTKDFKEAKVTISVLGSPGESSKALHALQDAKGFIQKRLGKSIRLRNIPALRFVLDDKKDRVTRIEELLDESRQAQDGGEE